MLVMNSPDANHTDLLRFVTALTRLFAIDSVESFAWPNEPSIYCQLNDLAQCHNSLQERLFYTVYLNMVGLPNRDIYSTPSTFVCSSTSVSDNGIRLHDDTNRRSPSRPIIRTGSLGQMGS